MRIFIMKIFATRIFAMRIFATTVRHEALRGDGRCVVMGIAEKKTVRCVAGETWPASPLRWHCPRAVRTMIFASVNQVLVRLWARFGCGLSDRWSSVLARVGDEACNRANAFRGDMFCAE